MMVSFADMLEIGVVELDPAGRIRLWNRWMADRSGRQSQDVLGLAFTEVFPEAQGSRLGQAVAQAIRQRLASLLSPGLNRVRLPLYHRPEDQQADRRMVHLIHIVPYKDDVAGPGCLLQISDVTLGAQREQLLRNKEHQLRNAARIAQLGTWEWDLQEGASRWSQELYRLLGLSAQDYQTPSEKVFLSLVCSHERAAMAEALQRAAQLGQGFQRDCKLVHNDGTIKHVHVQGEVSRDLTGKAQSLLCTVQDITERKLMEANLLEMASTDVLTGLPNRRHMLLLLGSELARVKRRQPDLKSSLLMLDLDHFKRINDTFGHAVGDVALRHFADVAGRGMRKVDILGRLGGEEFAVLLPDTDLSGAIFVAERLRLRVQASSFMANGQAVQMTVSVGVGLIRPGDPGIEAALARCDQALYLAKQNGRNRSEVIEPE